MSLSADEVHQRLCECRKIVRTRRAAGVNAARVSAMPLPPTVTTTRDGFASIEMGWLGPGIFISLSGMICPWSLRLLRRPHCISSRSCRRRR
jgi:hypothetical protein